MNHFGKEHRDYGRFRESDSSDDFENDAQADDSFIHDRREYRERRPVGRFSGRNRFGEERIRHDPYQDDVYQDEYGMRHPYEHGGRSNRWSDDIRSEASRESHRGKGPKGYARSSERMHDEACEILARDFDLDASNIEVVIQGDILVLKGEVDSRHDKRRAEDLVEDISGVSDVHNQLRIRKGPIEGWIPGIGNIDNEI